MQTTTERRAKPRYAVRYPAWYSDVPAEDGCYAFVTDVGWGGLFLSALKLRAVGTPLLIHVTVTPNQEPVPFRGEVAWVTHLPPKGPGMGIRLDLDQPGLAPGPDATRLG